MSTSISPTSDLSFGFGYSEMFVAAPFDLDYDEPNAVVAEEDVEFVTTVETVKAVELPVTGVIEEEPVAKPAKRHETTVPAQRRTAA